MGQYRSTYPYPRIFPDLGLIVEPDQIIERDENPDANFFEEVTGAKPAAAAAPPAPPEAAPTTTEETI